MSGHTRTHIHTHDNYYNPRCARVNYRIRLIIIIIIILLMTVEARMAQ